MNCIKNFIKLQECMDKRDGAEKILKNSAAVNELKKLKSKFEEIKKQYLNEKKEVVEIQNNYNTINAQLKSMETEIQKNEDDLYNKAGSDLKLIEKLQKDIQKNKEGVQKLEDEVVDILEKEEKAKLNVENLRAKLIDIKDQFTQKKESMSIENDKSRKIVEHVETEIDNIKKKMNIKDLNIFNRVAQNINPAVVKLENGMCTGCKMHVSRITLNNSKNDDKIVYCDNCGRILYNDN